MYKASSPLHLFRELSSDHRSRHPFAKRNSLQGNPCHRLSPNNAASCAGAAQNFRAGIFPMTPLVISFYTKSYEERAKQLENSCKRFGIPCQIEKKASQGSWEKNCAFKPVFILEKLKKLKAPVVWVDADAQFKAMPNWRPFTDCDIALRINPYLHRTHTAYMMSGTLLVNPTVRAYQFLEAWQEACAKSVSTWDQVALARLIEKHLDLRVASLPYSYVKTTLWDSNLITDHETIIEHGQ